MKRMICILLISVLALSFAGCGERGNATDPSSPETPGQGPESSVKTAVMPDTITIDELLALVNPIITGSDGDALDKIDAEKSDVELFPGDDDILYLFTRDGIIISLIESRKSGYFKGAYFLLSEDNDFSIAYLVSYAELFLDVLEPNAQIDIEEALTTDSGEPKEISGEGWNVYCQNELINVIPKG